jgi:hypothetical protein
VADENPSGLGSFDPPLRLPEQYFDKKTTLFGNLRHRRLELADMACAKASPRSATDGITTTCRAHGAVHKRDWHGELPAERLGQRIRKSSSLGDTVFDHDSSGRLIAETSPGGTLKREVIYLGDIPVGVIQ